MLQFFAQDRAFSDSSWSAWAEVVRRRSEFSWFASPSPLFPCLKDIYADDLSCPSWLFSEVLVVAGFINSVLLVS